MVGTSKVLVSAFKGRVREKSLGPAGRNLEGGKWRYPGNIERPRHKRRKHVQGN